MDRWNGGGKGFEAGPTQKTERLAAGFGGDRAGKQAATPHSAVKLGCPSSGQLPALSLPPLPLINTPLPPVGRQDQSPAGGGLEKAARAHRLAPPPGALDAQRARSRRGPPPPRRTMKLRNKAAACCFRAGRAPARPLLSLRAGRAAHCRPRAPRVRPAAPPRSPAPPGAGASRGRPGAIGSASSSARLCRGAVSPEEVGGGVAARIPSVDPCLPPSTVSVKEAGKAGRTNSKFCRLPLMSYLAGNEKSSSWNLLTARCSHRTFLTSIRKWLCHS